MERAGHLGDLAQIDEKQYGDARFLIYCERRKSPVQQGNTPDGTDGNRER
jgi:hypothetical protein